MTPRCRMPGGTTTSTSQTAGEAIRLRTRRLDAMRQTPGGFTTCTETYSNGVSTGSAHTKAKQRATLPDAPPGTAVCCAAEASATSRNAAVPRTATSTTHQPTATTYINNLILLNDGAAQKVANARTFPEDMRRIILAVRSYVFNSSFPYHFLYLNSLDLSKLAVSKASLHVNEDLELSGANKLFIKAYNEVASGTTNDNGTLEASDGYYSDEYDDDEDDGNGDITSYLNSLK